MEINEIITNRLAGIKDFVENKKSLEKKLAGDPETLKGVKPLNKKFYSVKEVDGPITVEIHLPYNTEKGDYSFNKIIVADKRHKRGKQSIDELKKFTKTLESMKHYFGSKFSLIEPGYERFARSVYPITMFTKPEEKELDEDHKQVFYHKLEVIHNVLTIQRYEKIMGKIPFDEPKEVLSEISKGNLSSLIDDFVRLLNKAHKVDEDVKEKINL